SDFAWQDADTKRDADVGITLSFAPKTSFQVHASAKSLQKLPADSDSNTVRLRHNVALFALGVSNHVPARAVATSRQFVLAQFDSVAGSAKSIALKDAQDDPALQLLADVFVHADRN